MFFPEESTDRRQARALAPKVGWKPTLPKLDGQNEIDLLHQEGLSTTAPSTTAESTAAFSRLPSPVLKWLAGKDSQLEGGEQSSVADLPDSDQGEEQSLAEAVPGE